MFPSIADPPDRFDIVFSRNALQLLPDLANMLLYYTAVSGSIQSPYGFIDPFPVKYLSGMGQQKFQNIKFPLGKLDFCPLEMHGAAGQIDQKLLRGKQS